jgi:hypothetical protein
MSVVIIPKQNPSHSEKKVFQAKFFSADRAGMRKDA